MYRNGEYYHAVVVGEPIPTPPVLSFKTDYESTAEWLSILRERLTASWEGFRGPPNRHSRRSWTAAAPELRSYFDFTTIQKVTVPAALVLASEYDRLRRAGAWVPGAVEIDRWKPDVRAVLNGVGFLEMVGVHKAGATYLDAGSWRLLRFRSGDRADGEQVHRLLDELGVPQELGLEIYSPILEALTNTRQHAYPPSHDFPEPHFPGWWLTGVLDRSKRMAVISAFDHGLGIPATLRSWERYPLLERGFRRLFQRAPDGNDTGYDGASIALAMAVGRSSTGQHFRGRGLPVIEAAVDLCEWGRVTIYSRCGRYVREKGRKPEYRNQRASIGGTLITWDLRF